MLNYKDAKSALRDNVNNQNKKYLKELKSIIQINEHPNTRYINEYGLLLLLQKSNNQIAPCHIRDITIGDILLPGHSRVTGTFEFYAKGQPMVQLGPIVVSTNHYVMYKGKPIKAGDHPFSVKIGGWDSDESLYCLNTDTHHIPVHYFTFLDYDETHEGDKKTMSWVEKQINGIKETEIETEHEFTEYGAAFDQDTVIHT
jgi:hypothetical protein